MKALGRGSGEWFCLRRRGLRGGWERRGHGAKEGRFDRRRRGRRRLPRFEKMRHGYWVGQ